MNNINWKQKLTSRKFWAAVITFVTTILIAFGCDSLKIEQVASIISAAAVMVAYIIGEGLVDSARLNNNKTITTNTINTTLSSDSSDSTDKE